MKTENRVFGELNLIRAYELVKNELKKTDYPLDPIYYPLINLVDQNKDFFFKRLSKYLDSQNYEADSAFYINIPKNEVRYRKVGVLSLTDRVVFQAIMNSGYLGSLFNSGINSKICFTPKVSSVGNSYFVYYQKTYDKFIRTQIQSFYKGYKWRITFDLERFFDTIPQKDLIKKLRSYCPGIDEEIFSTLESMLIKWEPSGFGIPQGPFASQTLSNFYLFDTDLYANDLKKQYDFVLVRYQDDFALMAKDEVTAKKVYEKIAQHLMDAGLSLNHKAYINLLENTEDLLDNMICPSENDTPEDTTFEKLVKYRKEIPQITEKIRQRKNLSEKDLRILKYYLKTLLPFREAYIEDIVSIIDKVPNFALYIVRYIEFNLRYNPNSYVNVDDRLKLVLERAHLPWWGRFWIYKTILTYKYPKNKAYVLEKLRLEDKSAWLIDLINYQEMDLKDINTADLSNGINPYIFNIFSYRLFSEDIISDYESVVTRMFNIKNKDLQVLAYYLCQKFDLELPHHIHNFVSVLSGNENNANVEHLLSSTASNIINADILNVREIHVGNFYGLNKQVVHVGVDERYLVYSKILGKSLELPQIVINDELKEVCCIYADNKVIPKENLLMESEWISFLRLYAGKKRYTVLGSPAEISRMVGKKPGSIDTGRGSKTSSHHQKRFLNRKDDINNMFNVDSNFSVFSKNNNGDWVCNAKVTVIHTK